MKNSEDKSTDDYKKHIMEMVDKIENPIILNYIHTIVSGIMKEIETDSGKGEI